MTDFMQFALAYDPFYGNDAGVLETYNLFTANKTPLELKLEPSDLANPKSYFKSLSLTGSISPDTEDLANGYTTKYFLKSYLQSVGAQLPQAKEAKRQIKNNRQAIRNGDNNQGLEGAAYNEGLDAQYAALFEEEVAANNGAIAESLKEEVSARDKAIVDYSVVDSETGELLNPEPESEESSNVSPFPKGKPYGSTANAETIIDTAVIEATNVLDAGGLTELARTLHKDDANAFTLSDADSAALDGLIKELGQIYDEAESTVRVTTRTLVDDDGSSVGNVKITDKQIGITVAKSTKSTPGGTTAKEVLAHEMTHPIIEWGIKSGYGSQLNQIVDKYIKESIGVEGLTMKLFEGLVERTT
jgi:hypothetical protein